MKLKLLTLLFAIFISNAITGQLLNEYKYVIIPSKYDFLKFKNQHELNSLTKFLFEKEGFKTIYDNLERPKDLSNNPCLGLTADVFDDSGMFTTKLTIALVNCKNQKVLQSEIGKSKEKDYKKGFQEALRKAFKSVTAQNYSYSGSTEIAVVKKQVQKKEPKKNTIIESSEDDLVDEIGFTYVEEEEEKEVVKASKTEEVIEIREVNVEEADTSDVKKVEPNNVSSILYAQANSMGYQLVDSRPKVVFVMLNTSNSNIFVLKNKNGIIYKVGDFWYVEYYSGNELIKKPLDIKF